MNITRRNRHKIMRKKNRGRPRKKPLESFVEEKSFPQATFTASSSLNQPIQETKTVTGPLCECGEPVAEGQSSVCKKHIRTN